MLQFLASSRHDKINAVCSKSVILIPMSSSELGQGHGVTTKTSKVKQLLTFYGLAISKLYTDVYKK